MLTCPTSPKAARKTLVEIRSSHSASLIRRRAAIEISAPAAEQGISCQACHMSYEPGIPDVFKRGPAAVVDGRPDITGSNRHRIQASLRSHAPLNDSTGVSLRTIRVRSVCARMTAVMSL